MSRYIDADLLLSKYQGNIWTAQCDYALGARDIIEDIKNMHTADVKEVIQKWSDEHPPKTMLDDFLKKFPKAGVLNGHPVICPHQVGYIPFDEEHPCTDENGFIRDCIDCWNRPIEESVK